jgi:hypothetical protein
MKEIVQEALVQAEALGEQIRKAEEKLGNYQGEQITEDGTEEQLDRWVDERALARSVRSAATHLGEVTKELRWLIRTLQASTTE